MGAHSGQTKPGCRQNHGPCQRCPAPWPTHGSCRTDASQHAKRCIDQRVRFDRKHKVAANTYRETNRCPQEQMPPLAKQHHVAPDQPSLQAVHVCFPPSGSSHMPKAYPALGYQMVTEYSSSPAISWRVQRSQKEFSAIPTPSLRSLAGLTRSQVQLRDTFGRSQMSRQNQDLEEQNTGLHSRTAHR